MLAQRRRGGSNRACGFRQFDRHPEDLNLAGDRMLQPMHHVAGQQLFIRQYFMQIAHGSGGNAGVVQDGEPFVTRFCKKYLGDDRPQRIVVADALTVGGETRIGDVRIEAGDTTELPPEVVVSRGEDDVSVLRPERFVGRDCRMGVAGTLRRFTIGEINPGLVGEQRGDGIKHRHVDVLAPPEFNEMMLSGFQAILVGDKTPEQQAADLEAAWEEGMGASEATPTS